MITIEHLDRILETAQRKEFAEHENKTMNIDILTRCRAEMIVMAEKQVILAEMEPTILELEAYLETLPDITPKAVV